MDVAVGMPDLWPFVKGINATVSSSHIQVQRRAVLKRKFSTMSVKSPRANMEGNAIGFPGINKLEQRMHHGIEEVRILKVGLIARLLVMNRLQSC